MSPVGFLLLILTFIAGLQAGRVEFPEEQRLAAQKAYCHDLKNDLYEAIESEWEGVDAFTPLERLCSMALQGSRVETFAICLSLQKKCGEDVFWWSPRDIE